MATGYFDNILNARGSQELIRTFNNRLRQDDEEVLVLLRDKDNSFPVIYLLAPSIESNNLEVYLPQRACFALMIVAEKEGDDMRRRKYERLLPTNAAGRFVPTKESVKWMLDTGIDWDGPKAGGDSYDAAIDHGAIHLATRFPDSVSMCKIANLIFRRNRQGLLVHDLVWGFFQTADASAISVVGSYIVSDNQKDTELACNLLGLDVPVGSRSKQETHDHFTNWLAENRPYIFITGESLNFSTSPVHIAYDAEAKHVMREIDPRTRGPLSPLTEEEHHALAVFRGNEEGEQL